MNLKELKKETPPKWRVQSFSKRKPVASCVPYIDARTVMDLLDEVCSPENWQDDYKTIDGKLFAGIGICNPNGFFAWKWDCGVESKKEKEKGQASDAFKRAAVKWGIGRFIYTIDVQYVDANEKKTDSNYPYCIDARKQRIWDLTKHINEKVAGKRPEVTEDKRSEFSAPSSRNDADQTAHEELVKAVLQFKAVDAQKYLETIKGGNPEKASDDQLKKWLSAFDQIVEEDNIPS
ncbi:hypothetical protein LCGC14_0777920 [marine sediment metagenome]|uniref:Rad52/22 double-strand break repair protein n=1 Tax=marine sediment metagenome TaxID=412755 RepID=A0A0F9PWK9_9ZZZZ|nr:hypothetical protein [Desulfobacterales bacterium]